MSCSSCRLFGGPICASCRTLRRIRELLQGGLLLRSQEAAVVQARGAAGALVDLAEEAAPVLQAERETSGALESVVEKPAVGEATAGVAATPGCVGEEAKDAVTKEEHEESKEPVAEVEVQDEGEEADKEAEVRVEEPKKPAKEKKRKKRQEGGEKKERKRERRKRKERKEESEGHYSVEEPATPIEEKSPQRSQPARPSSIEDEGLDHQGLKPAPKPVASHPAFSRLLPPPPPPRRPRSPSHPPPDRKGGRGGQGAYWQGRPRSRSPAKRPRGSKGAKHRQRGIDRKAGRYY